MVVANNVEISESQDSPLTSYIIVYYVKFLSMLVLMFRYTFINPTGSKMMSIDKR